MKKIVFFLLLILLFLYKTQNVFAYQDAFTVDKIIIEGKIKQNNYKERYIDIAFRKGFEKLLRNILKIEDQKKIFSTELAIIKSFIQSYRIVDEQEIEGKYRVEISLSFKEESINQFFQKKGISYSASQSFETLIYPIFIKNSELQVFSGNKFFEEWNMSKEFEGVNFILPVESLDDLVFIKKNKDDLEEIDTQSLVDKYEIKNSAILILRYDENILNVFIKTDFKGFKQLKKIDIFVKDLENKKVREETILKLKSIVHDMWKEQNLIDASTPSYLTLNVQFYESDNLREVISKIKKISIIKSYNIQELNKNNAKIKVKYLGKIKSLENFLTQSGFRLKIQDNEWNLIINR
jgi:hypothetical protein